jgi:ribosomal protein S18 acetylase RimI-like enzyme
MHLLEAIERPNIQSAGGALNRRMDTKGQIRAFRSSDWSQVTAVLGFLPDLYPNANRWLAGRLADTLDLSAKCDLYVIDDVIAGILIQTPKGLDSVKLSTYWVAPQFRGHGIGAALLGGAQQYWRSRKKSLYVTVAESNLRLLDGMFYRHGFEVSAYCPNRYGSGRNELVYREAK